MTTLRSYLQGEWHEAHSGWVSLIDPCTEEPIARASTAGVDFHAALKFARRQGGLREMTFAERGALLVGLSSVLQGHRDELIAVSLDNTGATRKDAKFDIAPKDGKVSVYEGFLVATNTSRIHHRRHGFEAGASNTQYMTSGNVPNPTKKLAKKP